MSVFANAQPALRARVRARFFVVLGLANLIWAAQGTAVKFLGRQLGAFEITFLPFYVATLLMLPLLRRERRRNRNVLSIGWSDWKKFILSGVAGQVVAQLGMTWGISKSTASNGAILNLMIPIISAVMASLLLGERFSLVRASCLGLGLAGVLLLSLQDLRQVSLVNKTLLVGNFLIVGGCLGSSFYNVYCKGLLERFGELEILGFSYLTASAASIPLLIWVEPFHPSVLTRLDWKSWAAFAFLALLMYGASMVLFLYALQHLDVMVASASLYSIPLFGVLMARFMLGERLTAWELCGGGLVLAASFLIMRFDAPSPGEP
jgi:drug/metabolite transporter (DMT)-like permease